MIGVLMWKYIFLIINLYIKIGNLWNNLVVVKKSENNRSSACWTRDTEDAFQIGQRKTNVWP